jgi:hypothetical protein
MAASHPPIAIAARNYEARPLTLQPIALPWQCFTFSAAGILSAIELLLEKTPFPPNTIFAGAALNATTLTATHFPVHERVLQAASTAGAKHLFAHTDVAAELSALPGAAKFGINIIGVNTPDSMIERVKGLLPPPEPQQQEGGEGQMEGGGQQGEGEPPASMFPAEGQQQQQQGQQEEEEPHQAMDIDEEEEEAGGGQAPAQPTIPLSKEQVKDILVNNVAKPGGQHRKILLVLGVARGKPHDIIRAWAYGHLHGGKSHEWRYRGG